MSQSHGCEQLAQRTDILMKRDNFQDTLDKYSQKEVIDNGHKVGLCSSSEETVKKMFSYQTSEHLKRISSSQTLK